MQPDGPTVGVKLLYCLSDAKHALLLILRSKRKRILKQFFLVLLVVRHLVFGKRFENVRLSRTTFKN